MFWMFPAIRNLFSGLHNYHYMELLFLCKCYQSSHPLTAEIGSQIIVSLWWSLSVNQPCWTYFIIIIARKRMKTIEVQMRQHFQWCQHTGEGNCLYFDFLLHVGIFVEGSYEGGSKSFRTGSLERELQMVQLSATRCSCITILWLSLVSFAAITLCVASQWVFIV
jgi:hypothetical protein